MQVGLCKRNSRLNISLYIYLRAYAHLTASLLNVLFCICVYKCRAELILKND